MKQFNPNKLLQVEIYLNSPDQTQGYTIWHIVGKEPKAAISRKADGKDFDWMTERQINHFNNGGYRFKITAQMAVDTFNYFY